MVWQLHSALLQLTFIGCTSGGTIFVLIGYTLMLRGQSRSLRTIAFREHALRREWEMYAALDLQPGTAHEVPSAALCELIATHSAFPFVGFLTSRADGRLDLAASAGLHLAELSALRRLAREAALESPEDSEQQSNSRLTAVMTLAPSSSSRSNRHRRQPLMILPIRSESGSVRGAFAVWPSDGARDSWLERLAPLEQLACRLGYAMGGAAPPPPAATCGAPSPPPAGVHWRDDDL